jgi:hypothetical protein
VFYVCWGNLIESIEVLDCGVDLFGQDVRRDVEFVGGCLL